ncbi:hypothetical protein HRG_013736 [Hirsutella rhossiliensis]
MSQVLAGVRKLRQLSLGFCIDCVRVTAQGSVKLVLDWSHESVVGPLIRQVLQETSTLFLYETMERLGNNSSFWSPDASMFLERLRGGNIPLTTVIYRYKANRLARQDT